MKIVDVGTGTPVVLVPGIQGRWEWMKPTVNALELRCRVISFSLADEPSSGARFDEASGFHCYVEQIADALDTLGLHRAAICGVSYGGSIAAAFAVRHPERVSALVMVSALPPSWQPDARARFFVRAPWLLFPVFCCLASLHAYREISAAIPGFINSVAVSLRYGLTVLTNMFSPGRMARRVRMLEGLCVGSGSLKASGYLNELERVNVPTLVITGDPQLDRVVPVARTREYLHIWPHARVATLARTGHIGLVTRPVEFARIVTSFMKEAVSFDVPSSGGPHACSTFEERETLEPRTRTKHPEPGRSNDARGIIA